MKRYYGNINQIVTHIRPELKNVPSCRDCGRIPNQYSRFEDGAVQCIGADRKQCYAQRVEK